MVLSLGCSTSPRVIGFSNNELLVFLRKRYAQNRDRVRAGKMNRSAFNFNPNNVPRCTDKVHPEKDIKNTAITKCIILFFP